jgi:hypothetical protein
MTVTAELVRPIWMIRSDRATASVRLAVGDAHAFSMGEWWAGAAAGRRSVAITLGTGVGSCFLCDSRVLQDGPGIPPQGRVDLLRDDGKPLEESVSERAQHGEYAAAAPLLGVAYLAQRPGISGRSADFGQPSNR